MNALEKNRMICYGKGMSYAKDAKIARLQEDFARHFADSIDYEPETLINGVRQQLIVSRNKSVTNERRIFAYPGDTFYAGDVVDAYDSKWLITEVDQNKQVYTTGIMQICNRELVWQNTQTGEIIRRWVTAEKPYYSNLKQTEVLTMSDREFKIQVAYDEETSLIDLDKRFMLEIIAGQPRTYKVTSVDAITERFHQSGEIRGFLVLNVQQDLYNPNTDNKELMICDYIDFEHPVDPEQPAGQYVTITHSGEATIRQGGSAKKFTAHLFNEDDTEVSDISVEWDVDLDQFLAEMIVAEPDKNTIRLAAMDYVELQGVIITLTATANGVSGSLEIEVVS